jgi:sulfate/thiosulfate transport system ATP-binding protein
MSGSIEIQGLTKSFGSFKAVDDVSFVAEDGKVTALLGPSGSGKSTALRMIAGLERPDSGRITIAGEDQTRTSVQERRVGFVFQHYALFRHMTVHQNIEFGLRVRKEDQAKRRARVGELLDLVHMTPFADRYPGQLSGGQRQRVALARALAPQPKVLLLDEPFGALDAKVRHDLRRWLDELHREIGVTSLLVTHDQEEALELANTVVVMHEGHVEQVGSPSDVYDRPATPFVAGFVGSANVLHGSSHLEEGAPATAFVRPHDIRVAGEEGDVKAVIERLASLGWLTRITLRLDSGETLVAHVPNEELHGAAEGDRIGVDLRNPKAFLAPEHQDTSALDEITADT